MDLQVDRIAISYDDGRTSGDPSSAVQVSSSVVGDLPIPTLAVRRWWPRVGVDVDVSDPDDVRWLRARLPPDQPERRARLDAELALGATAPPLLLRGDVVRVLPEALARVPAEARRWSPRRGRCRPCRRRTAWSCSAASARRR